MINDPWRIAASLGRDATLDFRSAH